MLQTTNLQLNQDIIKIRSLMIQLLEDAELAVYRSNGLCAEISTNILIHPNIACFIHNTFESWEHYSGDLYYPIVGGVSAYNSHLESGTLYTGEYGQQRLLLARHMIHCCNKHLITLPENEIMEYVAETLKTYLATSAGNVGICGTILHAISQLYGPLDWHINRPSPILLFDKFKPLVVVAAQYAKCYSGVIDYPITHDLSIGPIGMWMDAVNTKTMLTGEYGQCRIKVTQLLIEWLNEHYTTKSIIEKYADGQ